MNQIYLESFFCKKCIVQIIDNKDYQAPSEPSFKNLKILKVSEINSGCLCYRIVTIYCLPPSSIFIDLKLFFHGYIVLDLIKTFDPISLAQP